MRIKICSVIVLILLFVLFLIFINPKNKDYRITKVISPCEVVLDNNITFVIDDVKCFDPYFSENNKLLAKKFNLTEQEAFIIGCLGKYWAKSLLEGRTVNISDNNLVYYKFGYKTRLLNSPYCVKDDKFTNKNASERLINKVQRSKYQLLNTETDEVFEIAPNIKLDNLILVRKGFIKKPKKEVETKKFNAFDTKDFKLIFTDFTTKHKPDRNCTNDMCKEILNHINNANSTIDMAIYGYSSVPDIEKAIIKAKNRGVKIRMVHDIDAKGSNIYENTFALVNIIKNTKDDRNSQEVSSIMHNKFYIFDEKIVITGSANLSHTDMSGFNANSIIVINSEEVAKTYTKEFEQMFNGKFHSEKVKQEKAQNIYFSPQDKSITNGVLPLIKNAKQYIYIPVFVITEKRIVEELINAKKRGIDVKIIADALNASAKYSKVKDLRAGGVPVKVENYAGKMHSKTIIIDDKYLVIGSMNFSFSGENKNDENMMILNNPQATIRYKEFFLYLWNKIPDKWLNLYPRAEGIDSIGSCTDGIDNDYDGLIDSADEGCRGK